MKTQTAFLADCAKRTPILKDRPIDYVAFVGVCVMAYLVLVML